MKIKINQLLPISILFLLALLVWTPLWMIMTGALTPTSEIRARFSGVLGASSELAQWSILPDRITLRHVVELLLDTPEFFQVFWNSCLQVFPAVVGQVLVGAPAAWAFGHSFGPVAVMPSRPNDEAIIRRVGALMLETNDEWAVARRYMSLETLARVTDNPTVRLPAVAS